MPTEKKQVPEMERFGPSHQSQNGAISGRRVNEHKMF